MLIKFLAFLYLAFLDIVDRIIDHGYTMPDWNGKRCTWGFWNPEALNYDPDHYSERNLNSLQLLIRT